MRADWDSYFMQIAHVVASRATCDRKHVGALLVRDRIILSTGYNGSIRGMPHCDEVGHMLENGHCVATIHAEANAILQAARNGVMIDGGTIYVPESATASAKGEWVIEGHGVDPDIEVDNDPKSVIAGKDPQLERAIAEVMKQLQAHPAKLPTRPAAPIKTEKK